MHDLPRDLQEKLKNYKDPYDRDVGEPVVEVFEDWEPIFAALREMHRLHPDMRFGQTITNLAFWAASSGEGSTYIVPDQRLLEAARQHVERLALAGTSDPSKS